MNRLFRLTRLATSRHFGHRPHVHLEIAGEERIERISRAAKSMPWQVLLLELAWTAGPATFVAAAGGYYLGFGKELPSENAIFFFAYTVIFGVIGLVTRLLHGIVSQPRKQRAQQQYSDVLAMLPDLCAQIRELRFENMDLATRRVEAAGYLLRRVDLDPQTISLLVEELSGDRQLANQAGKIEMYRRAGLQGRMRELAEQCRDAAARATEQLSASAPETAELLNERLFGRAPTYESGLARPENFIERMLAAIEQDDDKLMTLEDAEQMLLLAFELLSGRRLPVLLFEYKGHWGSARAMDKLNKRWNRYRIAKATGYSRLKALEELLANSSETDITLAAPGQAADALARTTLDGIRSLNDAAQNILALPRGEQDRQREKLAAILRILTEAMRLHASARRACSQLGRRHALFLRNLQAWEAFTANHHDDPPMLRGGDTRVGLQLTQRYIRLDDGEKLQLAADMEQFLRQHRIRAQGQRVVSGATGRERALNADLAKSLAIELLLALEQLVELSEPEIQRAIYASAAPNFHSIEPSQSAATKAGLGAAAALEVADDLGLAAERLAAVLVTQYQIELTAEAIDSLQRTYGARRQRLETLVASHSRTRHGPPVSPLHGAPRCKLLSDPDWHAEIARANRFLKLAR
jgi:hypothetical protein